MGEARGLERCRPLLEESSTLRYCVAGNNQQRVSLNYGRRDTGMI